MKSWRPLDWKNPYIPMQDEPFITLADQYFRESADARHNAYEAGADAMLEALKSKGLYGEYLEDYIISTAVKSDDKDWAEDFLATIEQKGWLIFIPDE